MREGNASSPGWEGRQGGGRFHFLQVMGAASVALAFSSRVGGGRDVPTALRGALACFAAFPSARQSLAVGFS